MILSYNLVSVGLCLVLYQKIESEDKRLAKTLKFKVLNCRLFILVENCFKTKYSFQVTGRSRNLYTAGVGMANVVVTFVYMIMAQIPVLALKLFFPVTTSIQVC